MFVLIGFAEWQIEKIFFFGRKAGGFFVLIERKLNYRWVVMRWLREPVVEEEGGVQGVDVDDEECRATVSNWAPT